MVSIRVLGPMHAEVDGVAADLGGPRQRGVLAMLLASRGDVVSVDRMIEDLWRGEPPPSAIASLQAYVSNLRRALEPNRPPRSPARILVSAAPGYAVRLDPSAVDAWHFTERLAQARQEASPEAALLLLDEASQLWRGPAYAEFADEGWVRAETARLDELHLAAQELQATLTLRTGVPGAAIPLAESIIRQHPMHEEGWRLLALALWGSGRPADALAALRRARATLADELGLDPGPALVDLESAILAQRTEVLHALAPTPPPTPTPPTSPLSPTAPPSRPAPPSPPSRLKGVLADQKAPERSPSWPRGDVFVGRVTELAALRRAAEGGRVDGGVALVSGEAGSGKSSLLRRLRDELRAEDWLVVAGRCPETDGAPPAWAWTEALRALTERVAPGEHEAAVAGLLGDPTAPADRTAAGGRFRMHRGVCGWLRTAAGAAPTAVILDDVHAADPETLALLATAARELAGVPVLLVASYRPAEAGTGGAALAETLAVLAGRSPTRVQLGGLNTEDVGTLVAGIVGSTVDSSTVAALAERTGGNPFYIKESARLLASEGALVATSEVPEGVRDVLRRRFARLPGPAVSVLRLAAVVGRESDVDVLLGAADVDEAGVLDALEAGLFSGLLTEPAPGRVRFVHALVRDTLYTDLSGLRRSRWHARVAGELEKRRPTDLTGLAHHYAHSASPETARLAVTYSIRAAEAAERRYAPDACVSLLTQAVASLDQISEATGDAVTDDERVDVLGRLLRAQIRAGQIGSARQTRTRAVEVAERAGRKDLLLAAYSAWTEPTPWQIRPYATVDERVVGHLLSLLDEELEPAVRCRLLAALVAELDGEGDPRIVGLADEAVALANASKDPWLIGLALTARMRDVAAALDPAVWIEMADQLDALGPGDEYVPYRWCSAYLRAKVAAATGDIADLVAKVERAAEIAETYRMAEAMSVTAVSLAALAHIQGDLGTARQRYVAATEAMARHGSLHADLFRDFAFVTVAFSEPDSIASLESMLRPLYEQMGPIAADVLAVTVAARGDREEAARLHALAPPARYDYFWAVFMTFRAMAMTATGCADEAESMYTALTPYRDELAGIGTIAVVMRPVAHTMGELALLAGDPDRARRDLEHAAVVARRWGAAHWEKAARERLAAL